MPTARALVAATIAAALLLPATSSATPAGAFGRPAPSRTGAAGCPNADAIPTAENLVAMRAAVLCLHNRIRAERRLPALAGHARLRRSAERHSTEMVDEGFFAHTDPDGTTFVDRILRSGYARGHRSWRLGENLAWGTGSLSTPAAVMEAWMGSAGHRANVLTRGYREVGIGIHPGTPSGGRAGATFTVDFGGRSGAAAPPRR